MEIIVPTDKPPLPHPRSHFVSRVRGFGILAYIGFILLFSMILTDGKISFFFLRLTVQLVGLGLVGLLVTWRIVRLGGAVLAIAMISALLVVPNELLEWRPWVFGLEAFAGLIGVLLLCAPRAAAKN